MMPMREKKKSDCHIEVFEDGSIRVIHTNPVRCVLIKPDDDCRAELHRFMDWEPKDE